MQIERSELEKQMNFIERDLENLDVNDCKDSMDSDMLFVNNKFFKKSVINQNGYYLHQKHTL